MYLMLVIFFFFQAEDGIRDYKVTGVQTCALPISHGLRWPQLRIARICISILIWRGTRSRKRAFACWPFAFSSFFFPRSGERRVGEECRSRWAPGHLKKKKKKCFSSVEVKNINICV